jgi:hypothetical protein
MERQTVAQGECPSQPIGRYVVSRAHLGSRLAHIVEAIQRVEHHAMTAAERFVVSRRVTASDLRLSLGVSIVLLITREKLYCVPN